ncbi:MAG: Gfo/Idh/MocA family oxidoreductase [Bryobacterales bacterium]|nr:Gfo/Idh/MocA family oxidoreductase [Acidobacteriota bacterium]MCB9384405.1 Gfo/Idh/MocA family oxidoreductase [Bryobacterales bacterium]
MSVRVALFGTKFMGKAHSQAYRNVNRYFADAPQVEMKVIVGRKPDETEEARKTLGWEEASTDWKAVMKRDDIDVVDISTPGNLHAEMAIEAAKNGKHIICEKPLANTLPEAERMLEAVENAGVRHFLMHNYRRLPAVAMAKRLIEDGRLGRIFHFRARYLQDWAMSEELPLLWRFTKQDSGSGALGDLGAHIIDLGRHLCGEIVDVAAATETFIQERKALDGSGLQPVTVDDAVVMCTRFANGAVGTLEATRFASGRKNHNTFEINGSKGSVVFDLENLNNLQYFSWDDDADAQGFRTIICCDSVHPYGGHWWPDGHIIGYEHSFTHSLYDFLMGLESGSRVRPDFDDGVRNQKVLDAAARAAEGREWVKVE